MAARCSAVALLGAPLGRPAPERFPPCKLVASYCFKYVQALDIDQPAERAGVAVSLSRTG
jgi:hypothetical protein